MVNRHLDVLIAGAHAGTLTQVESGSLAFEYDRAYRGVPLSQSMPLSTRVYRDHVVRPYVWGLLPEDPDALRGIARASGVSSNNPFALLSVIGRDCPGAVQFCVPGLHPNRGTRLAPITEEQIAARLAASRTGGRGWLAENERWSLAGQQSKFALRKDGERWYSCEGDAATTHILKSGVRDLEHQALNEYVCMRLAALCGIRAARVFYRGFEGACGIEPAIVIERYDRKLENGEVVRLHQEDFCQALGCLPEKKYAADGGPGVKEIIGVLKRSSQAQINIVEFLQMLFFNYVIAGTDAHAKNYSVMLGLGDVCRLAPLYDEASMAPYMDERVWEHKPPKLAMSIGGENRVGCVTMQNMQKMVEQCGLEELGITDSGCAVLAIDLANRIPHHLAEVFDELERTEARQAASELRRRMEGRLVRLCEKSKNRLEVDSQCRE